MKNYQFNKFNNIFFLLWIIITALLWALDDSEYPWVIQKILSGVGLIVALCSTTYFLCNYILPKHIHKNRVLLVLLQLVLLCFVQAFLLWIFQEGIVLLEARHILPISQFTQERETFMVTLTNSVPATILVNLGFGGLKFYYEHGKLYQQHLNLQKAHLETQLQSLQSKITPHFMFNVLNHIHILIQKDTTLASSLLLKYSDILRYQLYGVDKETVCLDEEISFIDNYIEVEKYRWANTLEVTKLWQVKNGKTKIAPLLLIIFIENAFKHVGRSAAQNGYIHIALQQNDTDMVLEVRNSKASTHKYDQSNSGMGLKNAKQRLELLYPNQHQLAINETDTTYQITLTISIGNDQH